MKSTIAIFSFTCLLSFFCHAQFPVLTLTVAPDTSYVQFSGMPRLPVMRSGAGANINFQMNRRDYRTFLDLTSYLQSSREVAMLEIATYKALVGQRDSSISVLKLKYEAEAQRTENFKTALEDVKLANQAYHTQLNACVDDLQKLNDKKNKGKGWTFIKGVLWGLAIGSVGGIAAGAAL
jgi:hypothetical protein